MDFPLVKNMILLRLCKSKIRNSVSMSVCPFVCPTQFYAIKMVKNVDNFSQIGLMEVRVVVCGTRTV